MREYWEPRMAAVAGTGRQVVDGWRVHDELVRFRVEGDRGQAFVTVLLAEDGFFGLAIAEELRDGTSGSPSRVPTTSATAFAPSGKG
jgi:hypothetical protein